MHLGQKIKKLRPIRPELTTQLPYDSERPVDDWKHRKLPARLDDIYDPYLETFHASGIIYQAELKPADMIA